MRYLSRKGTNFVGYLHREGTVFMKNLGRDEQSRPSHLTKIVQSRPRYLVNISLDYPFKCHAQEMFGQFLTQLTGARLTVLHCRRLGHHQPAGAEGLAEETPDPSCRQGEDGHGRV